MSRTGRYAWLISLSIHCAVLVGGFFAVRSYLRQQNRSEPRADIQRRGSGLYVVTSADAIDAVHAYWAGQAILPGGDSFSPDVIRDEQAVPGFNLESHQTLTSLQDHSPAIGRTNADAGSLPPVMGRTR